MKEQHLEPSLLEKTPSDSMTVPGKQHNYSFHSPQRYHSQHLCFGEATRESSGSQKKESDRNHIFILSA